MVGTINQNTKIEVALDWYLSFCQRKKRLDPKTIKAYKLDFQQFLYYLKEHNLLGVAVRDIGATVLTGYIAAIRPGISERSLRRKVVSIKAFFNYLESEGVIHISPLYKTVVKVQKKNFAKILSLLEIQAMFEFLYSDEYVSKFKKRHIAIFELLFAGFKTSELQALRLIDLKELCIKNPATKAAIQDYLSERPVSDKFFLFLNQCGGQLSDQSVRNLVERIGRIVLNKYVTPKMVRGAFMAEREKVLCAYDPRNEIQIFCKDVFMPLQKER